VGPASARGQRLHRFYSRLLAREKRHRKVVAALARELVGFLWALDRAATFATTPASPRWGSAGVVTERRTLGGNYALSASVDRSSRII